MKSIRFRSYSGPCFPVFGLNTERYFVSLRTQSECGKIRIRKKPLFGHFSRSVRCPTSLQFGIQNFVILPRALFQVIFQRMNLLLIKSSLLKVL